MNDEGRSDIGPQHDGKCRYQANLAARHEGGGHQPRRRAALKEGRHDNPGQEGQETVTEGGAEKTPQARAESTDNTAADHVQAPQQQRDAADEIKKNHAAQMLVLPAPGGLSLDHNDNKSVSSGCDVY